MTSRSVVTADEIQLWLQKRVSKALRIPAAEIDVNMVFQDLGMDSLTLVQITDDIGEWLDCTIDPELAYDHPTIEELAAQIAALPRS